MSYNQRTALRLESWFAHWFQTDPCLHFGADFNFAWRGKSPAALAARIREDWNSQRWDCLRQFPVQERRRANVLHRKTGPPDFSGSILATTWGSD